MPSSAKRRAREVSSAGSTAVGSTAAAMRSMAASISWAFCEQFDQQLWNSLPRRTTSRDSAVASRLSFERTSAKAVSRSPLAKNGDCGWEPSSEWQSAQ